MFCQNDAFLTVIRQIECLTGALRQIQEALRLAYWQRQCVCNHIWEEPADGLGNNNFCRRCQLLSPCSGDGTPSCPVGGTLPGPLP